MNDFPSSSSSSGSNDSSGSDSVAARDELVSAYLDDEATADERARVEADPMLLARVEVFRSLQRPLAAPVPIDPTRRDAHIATALAASTTAAAAVAPVRPGTNVVPLTSRRRVPLGWLAAAACIVGLFVAAPFVLRDGDDADMASTAAESADDAAGAILAAGDKSDLSAEALDTAMSDSAMSDADNAMLNSGALAAPAASSAPPAEDATADMSDGVEASRLRQPVYALTEREFDDFDDFGTEVLAAATDFETSSEVASGADDSSNLSYDERLDAIARCPEIDTDSADLIVVGHLVSGDDAIGLVVDDVVDVYSGTTCELVTTVS